MHSPQDRRLALTRLAAGASAIVVAAREMSAVAAGEVDAEKKKKTKAEFSQRSGPSPRRYDAVVGAFGRGRWMDMKTGKQREISDRQLERFILKQNPDGKLRGMPQLRLAGMNWRIYSMKFHPATESWRMVLEVCDSNSGATPKDAPSAASGPGAPNDGYMDGGCTCIGCKTKCYVCASDGVLSCAESCSAACSSGCR
ncbi:MAG: hypothetical protein ACR2J8_03865 [Thermomicrobiales bacterium]